MTSLHSNSGFGLQNNTSLMLYIKYKQVLNYIFFTCHRCTASLIEEQRFMNQIKGWKTGPQVYDGSGIWRWSSVTIILWLNSVIKCMVNIQRSPYRIYNQSENIFDLIIKQTRRIRHECIKATFTSCSKHALPCFILRSLSWYLVSPYAVCAFFPFDLLPPSLVTPYQHPGIPILPLFRIYLCQSFLHSQQPWQVLYCPNSPSSTTYTYTTTQLTHI